jgi:hypothetical protein
MAPKAVDQAQQLVELFETEELALFFAREGSVLPPREEALHAILDLGGRTQDRDSLAKLDANRLVQR